MLPRADDLQLSQKALADKWQEYLDIQDEWQAYEKKVSLLCVCAAQRVSGCMHVILPLSSRYTWVGPL